MKKTLAGLVLATSAIVCSIACSERAPQVIAVPQMAPAAAPIAPGVMTVNGSAQLEVSPDCADLTMTLVAESGRPGSAASALTKKQTDLVAAMQKIGIENPDMKISHMNLMPIYYDWPNQMRVSKYRAEVTITVTTKKFEQLAEMMEAGANSGAQTMTSAFRRSDISELKKKVREMALKAAREKAELTVKSLGIGIGRVTAVGETPAGHMWQSRYWPGNVVVNEAATIPTAGAQAVALGGQLQTLSLDVTVSYELGKS
jgi:uncharacterized protein YggE